MQCPYCESDLIYHDYYFSGNYEAYIKWYQNSWFKKKWDIYKCNNEDCEACIDNISFHTRWDSDELFEWHPC